MIRAIKHFLAKSKARRALRLAGAGLLAEARAELDKVADDLEGGWRVDCLNKIGMLSYDMGDFQGACSAYGRALESAPDDAIVLMNLGNARDQVKDAAGAEVAYERALQIESKRPEILFNYGIFLAERDPPRAFRLISESIEACNADGVEWNGDRAAEFLVMLALDRGRANEALEFLSSLESRAKDEVARTCRLGRFHLLSRSGRHQEALAIRREHVECVVRSAASLPGVRVAMTGGHPELVVRSSRRKAVVLLLGCMVFSGLGLFMAAKGKRGTWVGIGFFGGIGIPVAIYQIIDRRPRLVINRDGITDRTLRVGLIPWAEIVGGELRSIFGQEFIALRLRDPRTFLERVGPVRRKLMAANKLLTSSELNLSLSGLPIRGRDVLGMIRTSCDGAE